MDATNRRLLALVQSSGKLSYAELGNRVGLSISAVNERLKKLQDAGIIQGYVAVVNPRAVGLDFCALIQVLIDRPESEPAFVENVVEMPEVQECHHITGEYSYLLKVRARNTADFETLFTQRIKSLPGVVRTLTLIALSSPKETAAVTLYDDTLSDE